MYKVVIVDDEPIIVEGLSRTVPWEKYNCEIVATANDGIEGKNVILQYKPDIIFSDIAMPDVDGLSMIAGIKSEFPNTQITILTGYRDFDYAQRAINIGVTRFLLKPSKLDEIEEAVKTMTLNLVNQKVVEKVAEKINEEIAISSDGEVQKNDSIASSFIVKNAIKYIESNYFRKLTLSDVAEKTYVSQWHLSKLLNKHTGQNFSEILNTTRINEAKKLLKDPSLRIGDIAETVGFVDMAHFSRVFKKTIGISANEYRNKIAMNDIEANDK